MVRVFLNLLSLEKDLVLHFRGKAVKFLRVDIHRGHVTVVGAVGRLTSRQGLFKGRTSMYKQTWRSNN